MNKQLKDDMNAMMWALNMIDRLEYGEFPFYFREDWGLPKNLDVWRHRLRWTLNKIKPIMERYNKERLESLSPSALKIEESQK